MSTEDRFQKGYEFVGTRPVRRPDYDYERLLEIAQPKDGYTTVTINLPEGQTAWHPGSTKHVLHGPAKIRYDFYPEGVNGTILE